MRVVLVSSFIVLAACARTSPPEPLPLRPDGPSDAARNANLFGFDLWRELGDGNLVFSPSGAAAALAIVGSGAHGETAAAFTELFHGTPPRVMTDLVELTRGVSGVTSTNTIVVDDDVTLSVEYRAFVEGLGASFAEDAGLDMAMRLTHRATLASRWRRPFEPTTAPLPFYVRGVDRRDVPMMHKTFERFQAAYLGTEAMEIVVFFDESGEAATILVVPRDRTGLARVEALLGETFLRRLHEMDAPEISLTLPKIDFASADLDLAAALRPGPLAHAFGPGARFDSIDRRAFIGRVEQSSRLRLDEGGVRADSETTVEMWKAAEPGGEDRIVETPPRVHVLVDRPFLVLVQARESDAILFMARVVEP